MKTESSDSHAIGHLDLVGAQSMAITDPTGFAESLTRLQAAVKSASKLLGRGGQVYLFADCLYFEAANAAAAVKFASSVRTILLGAGSYFKCAVSPGRLEAQAFASELSAGKSSLHVQGTVFGAGCIPVYQLHNKLGGVGISVSPAFSAEALGALDVVQNVCLAGQKQFSTFLDVKLPGAVATNRMQVDDLFEGLRRLRFRSRELPGKYLPLLLNFIRSTEFDSLDLTAKAVEERQIPPILEKLSFDGVGRSTLGGLSWFPLVQIALIDQVFETANQQTLASPKKLLTKVLGTEHRLPAELDRVPTQILGERSKDILLRSVLA